MHPISIAEWLSSARLSHMKPKKLHRPRSMSWHVDETYIRVGGKWRYLWRAVDQHGRFVDFRLTARRDAKAANAFFVTASVKLPTSAN